MRTFAEFLATAELHKGGSKPVAQVLPSCLSADQLRAISDDRYLSQISLRVFQAGLKHKMVLDKWPHFEEVFKRFDPWACAMLSDEEIEALMQEKRIIRHMGKIKSIRQNAQMIRQVGQQHGSFGEFIAQWPIDNIIELWWYLKKHGAQLGGQSGARFLRNVGKDTFLLTEDVVNVLVAEGVLDKTPSSKKDWHKAQQAFNVLHQQSGRPFCEISRILSMNTY